MLRGENGSIRFFIHPELRTIVEGKDLAYIEALLLDLPERAKQRPAELFEQISSLAVGPLVVKDFGSNLLEHPSLLLLLHRFVEI
jgi:hypothetical protein